MHRDIEWDIQLLDQRADVHVHAVQVMDMHPRDGHRLQQGDQIVQALRRQGDFRMAVHRRNRQRRTAVGGQQQQEVRLVRQARHQAVDVTVHPAAQAVTDQQDGRFAGFAEEFQGDGEAVRADRVHPDMHGHQFFVVRVATPQQCAGGLLQYFGIGFEADRALMIDEHVAGEQVAPSALQRTHAEVVFLAIAATEAVLVEIAEIVQRVPPDIHTKTHRRRHRHRSACIRGPAGVVHRRQRQIEQDRSAFIGGIAANRGVVGK